MDRRLVDARKREVSDSMILARRISKLEKAIALTREKRLVLRFTGPGSDRLPQPTQDDMDSGAEIFTVCFVAAKDGRPA